MLTVVMALLTARNLITGSGIANRGTLKAWGVVSSCCSPRELRVNQREENEENVEASEAYPVPSVAGDLPGMTRS